MYICASTISIYIHISASRCHHRLQQVGLLNVDGYYDSLLAFMDQAVEEGFISSSARGIIVQAPTAQDLMDKLEVAP